MLSELEQRINERLPQDKVSMLNELIEDFKPIVQKIESRLATTKGHYGHYLALMSKGNHEIMVYVLLKAGANEYGVSWAYGLAKGG